MPNLQENKTYKLVAGPSKWDLMIALFQGNTDTQERVEFTVDGTHEGDDIRGKLYLRINVLGREDGSGDCWLFEGFAAFTPDGNRVKILDNFKVHGYFGLRSRQGWIQLGKPPR